MLAATKLGHVYTTTPARHSEQGQGLAFSEKCRIPRAYIVNLAQPALNAKTCAVASVHLVCGQVLSGPIQAA